MSFYSPTFPFFSVFNYSIFSHIFFSLFLFIFPSVIHTSFFTHFLFFLFDYILFFFSIFNFYFSFSPSILRVPFPNLNFLYDFLCLSPSFPATRLLSYFFLIFYALFFLFPNFSFVFYYPPSLPFTCVLSIITSLLFSSLIMITNLVNPSFIHSYQFLPIFFFYPLSSISFPTCVLSIIIS